jgi:hypothetical protein
MEYLNAILNFLSHILDHFVPYLPQIMITALVTTIMYKAHRDLEAPFSVFDFFLDPVTKTASISRTGQFIGILTATWIVAKMAVNNTLTPEMFLIYLGALGVSEIAGKWISAFYSGRREPRDDSKP